MNQLVKAKKELQSKVQNAWGDLVQLAGSERAAAAARESLYAALNANPDVATCTPQSIASKLRAATAAGLSISSGELGEAFLIPFDNRKKQVKEAQLIVGVKGYKKLFQQSNMGTLYEAVIRTGDVFLATTPDVMPVHNYDMMDQERHKLGIVGAWSAVKLHVGGVVWHAMTYGEMIDHRNTYANKRNYRDKSGCWHEDNPAFPKMLLKTCTLQLLKSGRVPIGFAAREALNVEPSIADVAAEQSPPPTMATVVAPAQIEVELEKTEEASEQSE